MSNLRYLTPGETLDGYPADAHNAFLSAYRRLFGDPAGKIGTGQSSGGPQLTVEVVNKSGAAINQPFPILKLTKPVITYTDSDQAIYRALVFEGDTPDADTDMSNIAVVQGPIGNDNGARAAVILGPTWCKVVVTDTSHTHAKPKNGDDTQLWSDTNTGARILWKESGGGTKFALISLGSASGLRWGTISTAGSAASTEGTPTTDGEIDLYGGETVSFNNYYPEEAPLGKTGCVDGNYNIITWSCLGW